MPTHETGPSHCLWTPDCARLREKLAASDISEVILLFRVRHGLVCLTRTTFKGEFQSVEDVLLCSEVVIDTGFWCEADRMKFRTSFLAVPREDGVSELRGSASPLTKKNISRTRTAQNILLRAVSHAWSGVV